MQPRLPEPVREVEYIQPEPEPEPAPVLVAEPDPMLDLDDLEVPAYLRQGRLLN